MYEGKSMQKGYCCRVCKSTGGYVAHKSKQGDKPHSFSCGKCSTCFMDPSSFFIKIDVEEEGIPIGKAFAFFMALKK